MLRPGWCSSVDWVQACAPKGCQHDSQSRHMPGLQARSPVGSMWEATTHWCFFPSFSLSLPLYLKINKILKIKAHNTKFLQSKGHFVRWYSSWNFLFPHEDINEVPVLVLQITKHVNEGNVTNHFQALKAFAGILQREQTLSFSTL